MKIQYQNKRKDLSVFLESTIGGYRNRRKFFIAGSIITILFLVLITIFLGGEERLGYKELVDIVKLSLYLIPLLYFVCCIFTPLQIYFLQHRKWNLAFQNPKNYLLIFLYLTIFVGILWLAFITSHNFPILTTSFFYVPIFFYIFWNVEELRLELKKSSLLVEFCDSGEYKPALELKFSNLLEHLKTSDVICLNFSSQQALLVIPLRAFQSKKDYDSFYEKVTAEA